MTRKEGILKQSRPPTSKELTQKIREIDVLRLQNILSNHFELPIKSIAYFSEKDLYLSEILQDIDKYKYLFSFQKEKQDAIDKLFSTKKVY